MRKQIATYYVYTLSDPRDNSVRYVGMTRDVGYRYKLHMASIRDRWRNYPCVQWIRSLAESGQKPILKTVQKFSNLRDASEKERDMIATGKLEGWGLTNVRAGALQKLENVIAEKSREWIKSRAVARPPAE